MTNHVNHDAALKLASTVGTNMGTLRKNKRALAHNLVLAVAVEGFGWADVWKSAKAKMGFAKLEKPEQNQINVLGTAVKTIILAWPTLGDDVKAAFTKGELIFSTLATSIKDAEKAADKAEADAAATEAAGEEASSHADADHGDTPPAPVADRSAMIAEVAAMFDADMDAAQFTADEVTAMLDLIAKVEAFKAATVAKAKAA
jgi:alkylhydroperoxidase family enzyme